MANFYYLMGVREDDFQLSHRFLTSWLLPPMYLAILRALISIYAFTTIFFIFGWQGTHSLTDANDGELSKFTSLTFWGIAFYFLFSTIHTCLYARRGYAPLDHWPRPLQALHSLFYTTIVTFPFLVTIVFWVLLYDGSWFTIEFDAWSNVSTPVHGWCKRLLTALQTSRHSLNSLFALLEVLLSATNPPPWLHLLFLIVILALYLALAYLTFATQGFYTYNFLNPASGRGRVAAYCFGILAAVVVVFVVVWLLIWVRRKFTRTGKKSRGDMSGTRYGDLEMFQERK